MVNAIGGDTKPLDARWMFAILVAVSLSAALFNGFPFLHSDTWGYSGIDLGGGARSLTPNFMARFLFPLFDIWSLPIINAVIFSILSICLLKTYLPRTSFGLYLGAVIASWVPFYIGYVMSDVWGLFMIMAMLISLKSKSPLIFLILSISITTHGGHLVLFPLLAVGVVILFDGRIANLIFLFGALVAAILIALFVSLLMNPWGGAHQMRWSILGSRLVNDHREVLHDYCETRAEADFCIHRDLLLSKAKFPDAVLWDSEVRERIDRPAFEEASRDFALFTLTRFPLKVTYTTLRTTAKLLLVRHCIITLPRKENPIENMEKLGFQPKSIRQFERSLQADGMWSKPRFCQATGNYVYAVYGVVLIALIVAAVASTRPGRLSGSENRAILFLLLAVVANALVYAFVMGVYPRYHYKLLFVFFIVLMLVFEGVWRDRTAE